MVIIKKTSCKLFQKEDIILFNITLLWHYFIHFPINNN